MSGFAPVTLMPGEMDGYGHTRGRELVSLIVVQQGRWPQSAVVWAGITLARISVLEDPVTDGASAAIIAKATRGSTRNFALGINMVLARLICFSALIRAKRLPPLCFLNVSRLLRGTRKWFQSVGE